MKVINKDGYTIEERKGFTTIVHSNTIISMKTLLGAFDLLAESADPIDMPEDVKKIRDELEAKTEDAEDKLTPEVAALITEAWGKESVTKVFDRRSEFQLNDSAQYYFEKVGTLADPTYVPSTDDVLRSRVRTTGIVQSDFKIKATDFSMFDVGGQRNERRKWIHCFDNVNAVVFVAALSEFDQVLYEDNTQNRLDEALDLFNQIANSKWFKETSMILFLNKKDLFEMKLQKKTFSDYRKDYDGANTFEECSAYCKEQFLKQRKGEKPCYPHVTTATDTKNVAFVFNAVVAIILDDNMKASGFT